jgi:hypothetical protein
MKPSALLGLLFPLGVHLDTFAVMSVVAVLVMAIGVVLASPRRAPLARRQVGIIVAELLLSIVMLLDADLGSLTFFWVALLLLVVAAIVSAPPALAPAVDRVDSPRSSTTADVHGWLALLVVGAPCLWLANVVLVAANGSSSLTARSIPSLAAVPLILVGAVTAGVAPLDRWRHSSARLLDVAVASEACLPIVGFSLAARALGSGIIRPGMLPLVLLVVIGGAGLGRAGWSVWQRREFPLGSAVERGVSFLVLAAPVGFAGVVGLVLLTIGSIASRSLPSVRRSRSPESAPVAIPDAAPPVVRPRRSGTSWRQFRGMQRAVAATVSQSVRAVEERYDLAVGVLMLLVVLFVFAE